MFISKFLVCSPGRTSDFRVALSSFLYAPLQASFSPYASVARRGGQNRYGHPFEKWFLKSDVSLGE